MKKLILLFLLIALLKAEEKSTNPPELKVAFSYETVDTLKYTTVKPLFEKYTQHIYIDKTIISRPQNLITVEIGNISVTNVSLDWDKTLLLTPDKKKNPSILLKNLSAFIEFDGKAHNLIVNLHGKNNTVEIVSMDIQIGVGFAVHPNNTVYAFVDSYDITWKNIDIKLKSTFAQVIVVLAELFKFEREKISEVVIAKIMKDLNTTLIEKSTQGLTVGAAGLAISLSLEEKPYIFYQSNKPFQSMSVNVEIKNNQTNATAPVAAADVMPDYINNGLQTQLFISDNLIQQILWAAFDAKMVNVVITNDEIPKDVPLSLNTSDIIILLPNIAKDFGPNKGIYLEVLAGEETPLAFIRDGRLVINMQAELNFWVDNDGSQYPKQGLENCTTCVKAVTLDTKVLATAILYEYNATSLGVQVLNVQILDIDAVGNVDPKNLSSTLNHILVPLIHKINIQLKDGIPNPLIGKFGVCDTSLTIITDYLLFGLSLQPAKHDKMEIAI